jgi:voltage-gated potassium channel
VLVVAGPESVINEVTGEIGSARTPRASAHSRVLIAGLGEGGTAAIDTLPESVRITTIDQSEGTEPDVVGDVTELETLRMAGIDEASALIVTVADDAIALLTVAMARSLSDDVEILTRVTEAEKALAAFRAGADYVLSVQRVYARLVAAEVHGERAMDPVNQIRLVRTDAASFTGESLTDARSNTERGWTVVGIARDGTIHTDGRTTIEADDEVFVAGGDNAIQEFERTVDNP